MGASPDLCWVVDCGRPVHARGWCSTHYTRWYVHGDPSVVLVGGRRRTRARLCRGDTGHGRWWLLVWYCAQERILTESELADALSRLT